VHRSLVREPGLSVSLGTSVTDVWTCRTRRIKPLPAAPFIDEHGPDWLAGQKMPPLPPTRPRPDFLNRHWHSSLPVAAETQE
jgi:hypothetical protein